MSAIKRWKEWEETGFYDAQAGEPACGYVEFWEANIEAGEYVDYVDCEAYWEGYKKFSEYARLRGRTVEQQVAYDANGGDWVWVA